MANKIIARRRFLGAALILVPAILIGATAWRHWNRLGGPTGPTGLKTILSTRQREFRLDEPMRFRVAVQNMGLRGAKRDYQSIHHVHFEIIGPDGKPVTGIQRDFSTSQYDFNLLPGMNLVAYDDDIRADYLIDREGEYSIRAQKIDDDVLESNIIRFKVKGGAVSEVDEAVKAILAIAPRGWTVFRSGPDFDDVPIPGAGSVKGAWIFVSWHGRSKRMTILMTRNAISIPPGAKEGWDRFSPLGSGKSGRFHIMVPKGVDEIWPAHMADMRKALGIE